MDPCTSMESLDFKKVETKVERKGKNNEILKEKR